MYDRISRKEKNKMRFNKKILYKITQNLKAKLNSTNHTGKTALQDYDTKQGFTGVKLNKAIVFRCI